MKKAEFISRWGRMTLSELGDHILDLEESIEPFSDFSSNTENGAWTSNVHRESISTWFGPSDFERVGRISRSIKDRT